MNSGFFHTFVFLFLTLNSKTYSNKTNIQLIDSTYTIISEKAILFEGGNSALILGIRAIKPRTNVAIEPNFSPIDESLCRNMKMLNKDNIKVGIKIVAHAFPGIL